MHCSLKPLYGLKRGFSSSHRGSSLKGRVWRTGGVPQVELEDPVENIGAKLVRQAAAKTNDLAGTAPPPAWCWPRGSSRRA